MQRVLDRHRFMVGAVAFFEHAAAIVLGLILMIVGLALGVTMVLLPAGLVVGLLGGVILVGGLFARFDSSKRKTST